MLEVNVKEARAKPGKLLKQVESGQHVLLTRQGKELVCLDLPEKKRRRALKGRGAAHRQQQKSRLFSA